MLTASRPFASRSASLPIPFVCTWSDDGREPGFVHIAGELDLSTAPQLERMLRDATAQMRMVVLDLHDLTFIDTAGARSIVLATSRARRMGRRLVLLPGPPKVNRLFALTGASDAVEFCHRSAPRTPPTPHRLSGTTLSPATPQGARALA